MKALLPLYDGAGNLFRMVDARMAPALPSIPELCQYEGGRTDGAILLTAPASDDCDFGMQYFNADGSGGMMCGNGGRCIVAFARDLGIVPKAADGRYRFEAPDCVHTGEILSDAGPDKAVRLSLTDVTRFHRVAHPAGWFLNTGCRHFVSFLKNEQELKALDINSLGPAFRYHAAFAPEGVNVDFVVARPDGTLAMRTYEKGVEAETLACGTGAVASAIAAAIESGRKATFHFDVDLPGGRLQVDFAWDGTRATQVLLSGPTHRH